MLKNFDESTRTRPSGQRGHSGRWARRHGLAPLEMVLVLPFLMMLMATIIVFGYAAMWKLRTETVAREVVWRQRWTRFSNFTARPPEWPEPGTLSFGATNGIESYAGDDALEDPIIAGPLPAITVDDNVLDYTRGALEGVATIHREPPVFATLAAMDFDVDHPILDDRFQFHQMGIGNYSRRFPVIYDSGMDSIRESVAIQAAVDAIVNSSSWPRLEALDRDSEFIAVYGRAPDFYPRVWWFSSTDHQWVEDFRLTPLINRIRRLPVRMGFATIGLYRSQLEEFPELQSTIDALRAWLNSLGG